MKRIGITAPAVIAVLALCTFAASSAAATPPLSCYKAQNDEFGVTGNYKNVTCTEKTAVLKGEYVLAEPLLFIKEDLWCAKMNPVVGPPGTGVYENSTCTKKQENGEYTEVIEPPSPPLACYEAQKESSGGLTGDYKNATCTEKTAILKSQYVLAEPTLFLKEDLWCAKMTPAVGPPGTGRYENATCTKAKENGEYTEVIIPEPKAGPVTVLFLTGVTFPVELKSIKDPNTILTQLQTPLVALQGEGLLLKIILTANATGEYEVLFLKVALEGVKCNTAGDGEGEVLVPKNVIELVYDALGAGEALGVGMLFKVNKFQFTCGKETMTIEGSDLGLVTPLNLEVNAESTSVLGSLRCKNVSGPSQGQPAETSYWNSTGTLETAKLNANLGVGTEKACELIGVTATTTITLSPTQMMEIMG